MNEGCEVDQEDEVNLENWFDDVNLYDQCGRDMVNEVSK